MRVAPPGVLSNEQRETLEQWARSRSLPVRQVQRAQIILLAADGMQDLEIAAAVNVSNQKAARVNGSYRKASPAWRKMPADRGGLPRLRSARSKTWFEKRLRGNQTTQPTGVLAPWQRPVASAKRACGGSAQTWSETTLDAHIQ